MNGLTPPIIPQNVHLTHAPRPMPPGTMNLRYPTNQQPLSQTPHLSQSQHQNIGPPPPPTSVSSANQYQQRPPGSVLPGGIRPDPGQIAA